VSKRIRKLKVDSDNSFRNRFHLPQDDIIAESEGNLGKHGDHNVGRGEIDVGDEECEGEEDQEQEREVNVLGEGEKLVSIPDVDDIIAEQDGKKMVDRARQVIEKLTFL
jgi:hypothetical protein